MKKEAVYNVIIENSCILLVKKNNLWKLPGGIINPGKDPFSEMFLHIKSELAPKSISSGEYFGVIDGDDNLKAHAYFVKIELGIICPGPDIEGAGWFKDTRNLNLEPITETFINLLRQLGRIK